MALCSLPLLSLHVEGGNQRRREWPLKYEPIVRLKTANFSTLALGRDGGGGVLESPCPARARPPVLVLIELRLNRGQVGTEQTLKDCVDPEMKML